MKATELMIGDWVYDTFYKRKMRVFQIDSESFAWCDGKGVPCVELEPIPPTPEILEKNFSSTPQWYFIGTDKYCFRIDKYKDKWDLYFAKDGKGTNLQIKISYVHELQHALRLCRIDKEIKI